MTKENAFSSYKVQRQSQLAIASPGNKYSRLSGIIKKT
jgi:hypothetical protein